MGREIRRVPPEWQHPIDPDTKRAHPLFNKSYETAAKEWIANMLAWEDGTHEDLQGNPAFKHDCPHYWDWADNPPNREYYRPEWGDAATAYQVYETVSEGTPISPVFDDQDGLRDWLRRQGYSIAAVEIFLERGYAPTGMVVVDASGRPHVYRDIDTLDIPHAAV